MIDEALVWWLLNEKFTFFISQLDAKINTPRRFQHNYTVIVTFQLLRWCTKLTMTNYVRPSHDNTFSCLPECTVFHSMSTVPFKIIHTTYTEQQWTTATLLVTDVIIHFWENPTYLKLILWEALLFCGLLCSNLMLSVIIIVEIAWKL